MKSFLIPTLAVILLAVTMTFMVFKPETTLAEMPKARLGEIAGFTCESVEVSESERTTLPADTWFDKRMYKHESGHWFLVSLVIGGSSKSSIHRPELCLPSQGYLMSSPHTVEADGIDWRMIYLDGGDRQASLGFAYTFFNQTGYRTASHARRIFQDIWDRSMYCRIDRWAMITVSSSVRDEAMLKEFLKRLKGVVEQ